MRVGRGFRLRVVAAAVGAAVVAAGLADARDEDLFIRPDEQFTTLFASVDAGRSTFASAGAKQTLTGPLDRTGFLAMEASGYGLTRERFRVDDVSLPATRLTHQNAAMAGFQWALNGVYVAALAGPEVQIEQLTIAGRVLRWSQPRFGARGQVEVWSNPTADTLLTATLVAGTTRTSLWGRASAGLRVPGWSAFVGPEVTTYLTPTYREVKVGAHLTGVPIGLLHLRASAGWMMDDGHRSGSPYAGVTAWIRL